MPNRPRRIPPRLRVSRVSNLRPRLETTRESRTPSPPRNQTRRSRKSLSPRRPRKRSRRRRRLLPNRPWPPSPAPQPKNQPQQRQQLHPPAPRRQRQAPPPNPIGTSPSRSPPGPPRRRPFQAAMTDPAAGSCPSRPAYCSWDWVDFPSSGGAGTAPRPTDAPAPCCLGSAADGEWCMGSGAHRQCFGAGIGSR
jgi:hypothetical protein